VTDQGCATCGHFRHEHKPHVIKSVSGRTIDMGYEHCERFACTCPGFTTTTTEGNQP